MAQSDSGKIIIHPDPELADLIPGYLESRTRDITEMRGCLATGDFERIRILGHSMKGSGGGYGFDGITEIGKSIELAAKASDSAAISAALDALADYMSRLELVYD